MFMNISIPDYLSPDIISLFGDREVYVDYCHISTRADIVKDILKGRVFLFFGVSEVNGKFVSAEPERIAFSAPDGSPYAKYNRRFQKSAARKLKPKKVAAVIAEKQLRLARLNEEHLDTMLAQSKKDYEFVLRFNEEMYFKHIPDSDGFLNSAASYAIQNKQALCIFISAYALAFLGFS
ncbi:MAG: hypothetical protein LBN42_04890, partial [Oscillospiraceae bacterium]|nr:hypothetical protein [Oscillospiraceae bacterium]